MTSERTHHKPVSEGAWIGTLSAVRERRRMRREPPDTYATATKHDEQSGILTLTKARRLPTSRDTHVLSALLERYMHLRACLLQRPAMLLEAEWWRRSDNLPHAEPSVA